jgi:hypothetical protein
VYRVQRTYNSSGQLSVSTTCLKCQWPISVMAHMLTGPDPDSWVKIAWQNAGAKGKWVQSKCMLCPPLASPHPCLYDCYEVVIRCVKWASYFHFYSTCLTLMFIPEKRSHGKRCLSSVKVFIGKYLLMHENTGTQVNSCSGWPGIHQVVYDYFWKKG